MLPTRVQYVSVDIFHLEFVAAGKSGAVYTIDENTVLKEFHEEDDLNTEKEALELLNGHPNIVGLLGQTQNNALVLERGKSLRIFLQAGEAIPWPTKIQWIKDAAQGISYMHEHGIIHADIGCHNMIIAHDRLKIIDFEGCGCRGKEAMSAYEWFSYPESPVTISQQTDIFAFGCAVYEIITDVTGLPLSDLMQACWSGKIGSANKIIDILQRDDHKGSDKLSISIMDLLMRMIPSIPMRSLEARWMSWLIRSRDSCSTEI
ncbi:kinase-like protein [Teratosphaeria nubilosa]|uniref:Kinase-like protein n=1 Tax=Teratosphaeria nubilosa TaxID=161662 RepID=A0A6G1L626_9PEZI|nr:kinase-like protein [Teratosphaeria nubilosa]